MKRFDFTFGAFESSVHLSRELPDIETIAAHGGGGFFKPLLVCDEHTAPIADAIRGGAALPRCVLPAGEARKDWEAAAAVLRAAREAGLGRDGLIIGVGGGVVGDVSAFAASVYMRGCGLALVSTTLLGMADASLGGKTGFDLFGVKNLVGTFYPARHVYLPLQSLASLPGAEWKSGMAEILKTAVLAGGGFPDELAAIAGGFGEAAFANGFPPDFAERMLAGGAEALGRCVSRAVAFKGRVVQEDPRETGRRRMLLNLGHTFAHALESSAGLGTVSHGEAVAWGMVRACELGLARGITPPARAEKIKKLITAWGYETAAPHPLAGDPGQFARALGNDKKKKSGALTFIVPDSQSACPVSVSGADMDIILHITRGSLSS